MRKFFLPVFLFLVLALPSRAFAAKSYRAEQFNVEMVVLPGGQMDVTETITFRFEGGPFTYVFREISLFETDGVSEITARMDGAALPQGDQPGQVEIHGGDPVEVRWHFAPTSDSRHTFELKYRVAGVVRPSTSADTILWKAIPEEHEYEIDRSQIRIVYPSGVEPLEPPSLDPAANHAQPGENEITLTGGPIVADQDVLATLRFPAGSLGAAVPQWKAMQAERNRRVLQALPYGLGAAVLVSIAGLLLLRTREWQTSIENFGAMVSSDRVTRLPSELPPAIAGMLARGSASPTWDQGLATLFDLARRGVISIDEQESTPRWLGRRIAFTLQPVHDALAPHERGLIEMIFQTRKGMRETASLTDLQNAVSQQWAKFAEPLKAEMQTLGWIDRERLAYRSRWRGIGAALIVMTLLGLLAAIAIFVSISNAGRWDWLTPAAMAAGVFVGGVIVSLALLTVASLYLPFTPRGMQAIQQWQSYAASLRAMLQSKQVDVPASLFEPYLLYATSVGLVGPWIKHFQRRGDVPLPAWFHLAASRGFVEDWGAFAAMVQSTNSSGADGGGGGGGGSGGGASGAG